MKRISDIARAILASLRPSSNKLEIDTYGQSSLPEEEERGIREWLFASLMNAGYFGKAHLIWDSGNQSWDKPTLTVAACKHNHSGLQTRRELAQIICN